MAKMLVEDLMTGDIAVVRESDNLATAYDLMESLHIRHLPVVDEEGVLVGLVSHRDLLRALYAAEELPVAERREMLRAMEVRQIMTPDPEPVEPGDDLADAGERMLENKFGCVLVVEGEKLVGILTEADFVRHVVDELRGRSR
jgi:CBS domain-containing membrane protein